MKRTYKYMLRPNALQRETLQNIFWFCRFLYNCALEERVSSYKKYHKSPSYKNQSAELPQIKEMFAVETANIHSQSLQQVLKQVDVSYQNFFRRVKNKEGKVGFPRFKKENRFKSICFPQPDPFLKKNCIKLLPSGKLKISRIPGELKVVWHRELPKEARCKQVRIVKQADKYYICFSCEGVAEQPLPKTNKTMAFDLGITNFITADDGTRIHHPKPYKTAKEKLAFLNKRLAAKQQGSNNRKKALVALQRASEKVKRVREDFQHKVAKQLVTNNDVIILEDFNVKSMLEAEGSEVNKSNVSDAAWGSFAAKLLYKAESAGRVVILVNPRNTSKMCSACKNIKEDLKLHDRTYNCNACGVAIDRDLNAAYNIKRLGTSLGV
jgi:putative transposase